jgi:dual specificity protein kinase YAK1
MKNLSLGLCNTYRRCNNSFKYAFSLKDSGKVLTKNSVPTQNNGKDNSDGDYIFHIGDEISASDSTGILSKNVYIVESMLGHGTFGQVFRCYCKQNNNTYALKIIKNHTAYTKQAYMEKQILEDVYSFV